jgi:spore maturation protein SpmA
MLNYIWLGLIVISVVLGGFTGKIGEVGTGAIESAKNAVMLAASLVAVMTLWLGIMRLASRAGLVHRLGLALKPAMRWLFPDVPADHPALGSITMNFAANLLGLDNAATPLGLRAMAELDSLNPRPGVATNAMCMLLAINTSGVTLIPATVIALLASVHSKNPTAIIATTLAATAIAHIAAITAAKLLERSPMYRLPAQPAPRPSIVHETIGSIAGGVVEVDALLRDEVRPWVKGGSVMLWGLALLFVATLVVNAFPEVAGMTVDPSEAMRFWLWRLLDAVSRLAVPWLLLFFPLYAALRRIPVYEEFVDGAKEGFAVALRILPYVVGMFVAVGMFRACGGMDLLARALRPLTDMLHFPVEVVPMALIRPFSGSAALGLLGDLAHHYDPDSLPVLIGATLYGCSETTFYVIAVYFGSVNVKVSRHAIPAGIVADIVCPIASVIVCNAMFG